MSATLRYARILNGFSPLISRRSAISSRMRAMAALSNPKAFHLDVEVEHSRAALRQGGCNRRSPVRRPITEKTAAASGAAHLGRGGTGGCGAAHQFVDFRRSDAGRQTFAIFPFGGDLFSHFVPVAALERMTHGDGRVTNPFEAVEHHAIAVEVALDDLPVVGARV